MTRLAACPSSMRNRLLPVSAAVARLLTSSVLRGSLWTIAGYGAAQVLRLASNLLLARLLCPEAFGLMALVNVLLQGLQMFSDFGIGPAIVQSQRGGDADFLNTAWTIQILRGASLSAIGCLIGWPAAALYGEPMLKVLLPLVGFTALVGGFQTTAIFTAHRRMELGRATVLQLVGQVAGLAAMATWAVVNPGVWALAAGGIVSAATTTALGFRMLPSHRHCLRWDWQASRELVRFGRWIFVSTILTFLAMQSDRLLLGKLADAGTLGVYSIALMLALLPAQVLLKLNGSVVFPMYSRLHREPAGVGQAFERVRLALSIAGCSVATALAASSPWLVETLYDDRYQAAGGMLRLLAFASAFQLLESTIGSALLAMGKAGEIALVNGIKLVALCLFVSVGYQVAGFSGAIVGLVGADAIKYLAIRMRAVRHGLRVGIWDVFLLVMSVVAALSAAQLTCVMARHWPTLPAGLWVLVSLIAGGVLCFLPVALAFLGWRMTSRGAGSAAGFAEKDRGVVA